MYLDDCRATILDSIFSDNRGGTGGAISVNGSDELMISRSHFTGNSASNAGAIQISSGLGVITNTVFSGNASNQYGGAVLMDYATLSFMNSLFSANSSTYGGAIFRDLVNADQYINCTFAGNGSIYGDAIYSFDPAPATVINSIFWGHRKIVDPPIPSTPSVITHSIVEGGHAGEGNLDLDPLFVRPPGPGPDTEWGTADDDYGDLRLQAGSPAIDAGFDSWVPADHTDLDDDGNTTEPTPTDLDGQPRFVGTVDMGPYEFAEEP